MAQLTITIPDAAVARVRTAFGRIDPATSSRVDATAQEVLDAVKGFIKSKVIDYETSQAALQKRSDLSNESW